MSNPVTFSFGYAVGGKGFGHAYNVEVPSGSLSNALQIPLFGEQGAPSKIFDVYFTTGSSSISALSVALDAAVPSGSTLRTNLYNATQNSYLIDTDISAGSGGANGSGSLSNNAGDQVYLVLVDILGSGFLISRLEWYITH